MPTRSASAVESQPLREACVVAALEVIAERGIEALGLRDAARRLGVSHQAPYKHHPIRDHLRAEVMRRMHGSATDRLGLNRLRVRRTVDDRP